VNHAKFFLTRPVGSLSQVVFNVLFFNFNLCAGAFALLVEFGPQFTFRIYAILKSLALNRKPTDGWGIRDMVAILKAHSVPIL
jgi:hypothetical protein